MTTCFQATLTAGLRVGVPICAIRTDFEAFSLVPYSTEHHKATHAIIFGMRLIHHSHSALLILRMLKIARTVISLTAVLSNMSAIQVQKTSSFAAETILLPKHGASL